MPECDHILVTTKLRHGRFISQCRCGLVVSTDFSNSNPEPQPWALAEEPHVQPER